MNFDIICSNCGAPSSPTVGVCPFCKAVMTTEDDKQHPSISKIKTLFNDGKIDQALSLVNNMAVQKPESLKSANFALLYVQTLIEVDAPSAKIKSILIQALNEHPNHPQLLEYLEVAEAEANLSHDKDDIGETELANIIRRSPENVHALFLLGAHLFWIEKDSQRALRYLEKCVRLRPNFIRAKACLAAVYKDLNMHDFAARLLTDCATKTSDKWAKEFFKNFAKAE